MLFIELVIFFNSLRASTMLFQLFILISPSKMTIIQINLVRPIYIKSHKCLQKQFFCLVEIYQNNYIEPESQQFIYINFNMSQLDQLATLITNILQGKDEATRKGAEETLVNLRTERPNELISAFIAILDSQYKTELRNFSASQLRLNLSNFSPATYTNLWNKITPQTQQVIKVKLFEIIYKEKDLTMQKYIADTLGEIAGSVIGSEGISWPEFKNHVYTLFQDQNTASNLAAFYILESFFSFAPEYFKDDSNDLYSLFRNSFCHENEKLKLAALRSFSSYLEVLETKHHEKFQEIIIPLFTAVYELLKNNSNEEGLETLSEMIDIEPKFFKKKLKELNELLQNIFKMPDIESGVKRMATEMLVDYAEKYPALFRKKKDILQNVIEMIFYHMVEISSEIDPEWMSPKEGYNEDMQDDEDFETTRFGMGAIDRLIYSVGEEETMVLLSATIQTLLSSGDWRYKYTAVMALSQVGEYIEEAEKISSIMDMIIQFLRDQNPMLRYASCHAIGQISDDMQPKFQERYGLQILPELVNLLSDSVPRVVSHSAAALTNFLEGMKYEDVQQSLQPMMNMMLQLTSNGISLVKESCLSAISSIVEISKEGFQPYLEPTVSLMFSFFETEKYQAKEYKQLKGQSIETLTIIASSVGGKMFQPVAEKLIELMIHMQQSQFEQTDPQKTYILAGWQRLCLVYGKELASYLDRILPSLFKLVENVINNELKVVNDPEPAKLDEKKDLKDLKLDENINTFETEQAEVAISMLNVFIEQLKELYGPYVEKTVELLCTIIKDHPNDDVKSEACKCLPSLITAIKVTNPTVAVQLARHFMSTLVSTIEKEFDSDIMIVELETLKSVIEELDLCFLSQEEVKGFSEKMLNLLKSSDQKKTSSSNIFHAQEVDEEEKEIIGEEIKQEEEVQVAISELIGILFKTHKEMTVELAKYLINNILPSAFKEGQSEIMNKFGIFLIDDMIEYLGYEVLSGEWFQFGAILARFSQEKGCVLRQAACYGLGIFAEKTPPSALNAQGLQEYLDKLVNAIKVPKGTEKEKSYGHCKDNGVAALGKFIKTHNETMDLTQHIAGWFSCLPLRHDKPEAIVQHELLCDIVLNKDEWILGSDNNTRLQNIVRVLAVFGDLLSNAKIYNDSIKEKIKNYLLAVNQNELFKSNIQNIWGSLNDKQRKNLEAIANQ